MSLLHQPVSPNLTPTLTMMLVLLFLGAARCGGSIPENEGDSKAESTLSSDPPARLLFATARTGRCRYCRTWGGVIEVENIAYAKEVTVLWRFPWSGGLWGDWQETGASYSRSVGKNRELWSFDGVGHPGETELQIRYRVAGQEHWDNNGGRYYRGSIVDHSPYGLVGVASPLGQGVDVVVTGASADHPIDETLGVRPSPFHVDLLVRNIAYDKEVTLVYSLDDWTTMATAHATYTYGGLEAGEHWSVHESLPPGSTNIRFAVMAKQANREAWDNNYGRNFECRFDSTTPPTSFSIPWTCSGATFPH